MNCFCEDTGNVYRHLQDDVSRFLYEKRAMWSLSGNAKYMEELIDSLCDKNLIAQTAERIRQADGRLIIRGAGNEYQTLKRWFPDMVFQCFCDRDSVKLAQGKIDGHPVISADAFYRDWNDHDVLVNSSAYNRQIVEELLEHGVSEERIINPGKAWNEICDRQYFEPGIMVPAADEVFVDGGCYDGETFRRFAAWCGMNYKAIHAFEADEDNYRLAGKRLEQIPLRDVTLYRKGLWDEETTLRFEASGTQGSRISDGDDTERTTEIETTTVDNVFRGERVTFLKLDVEGAEYQALMGAKETIKKHHPRMAVSIYHKPEDIFTLPALILSVCEDYRFFLRHYQMSPCETILYAV